MTRNRAFLLVGLLVCLVIAGIGSYYASSSPDGLEKVAADKGFEDTARAHDLANSPFADYGTSGVDDARLAGGIAGVAGVGLTLALAGGLFLLLRRNGSPAPDTTPIPTPESVPTDSGT